MDGTYFKWWFNEITVNKQNTKSIWGLSLLQDDFSCKTPLKWFAVASYSCWSICYPLIAWGFWNNSSCFSMLLALGFHPLSLLQKIIYYHQNISHVISTVKIPLHISQSFLNLVCGNLCFFYGVEHHETLIFSNRRSIINMQHEVTARNIYPWKTNKQKLLNLTWLDLSEISANFCWLCLNWFCCLNSHRCQKILITHLGEMDNAGQFYPNIQLFIWTGKIPLLFLELGPSLRVKLAFRRLLSEPLLQGNHRLGWRVMYDTGASLQGKCTTNTGNAVREEGHRALGGDPLRQATYQVYPVLTSI